MRHVFGFSVPGAPSDSEDAVGAKMVMGLSITRQGRPAEGEPYLREALKDSLANHMTAPMISPTSLRGALTECLVAQRRYADAEPLLLENYDEAKTQTGQGSPQAVQATHRLHDLYLGFDRSSLHAPRLPTIHPGFAHPGGYFSSGRAIDFPLRADSRAASKISLTVTLVFREVKLLSSAISPRRTAAR